MQDTRYLERLHCRDARGQRGEKLVGNTESLQLCLGCARYRA
jgi:hypothetical protein